MQTMAAFAAALQVPRSRPPVFVAGRERAHPRDVAEHQLRQYVRCVIDYRPARAAWDKWLRRNLPEHD